MSGNSQATMEFLPYKMKIKLNMFGSFIDSWIINYLEGRVYHKRVEYVVVMVY